MSRDFKGPDLKLVEKKHPELLKLAKQFDDDGFIIIDLDLKDQFNKKIIRDIEVIVSKQDFKKNPDYYHYNESPRIIEAWRDSDAIKDLALNRQILLILEILYNAKPLAFSTINFIRGTEQPLHSDYIHFGSMPELYLVGAWTALEDISIDSGPLSVVKKSHKTPIVNFQDLGFSDAPKTTKQIKERYTRYEEYLQKYIEQNNLEIVSPLLKAGQTLIWSANLFHGAQKINNKSITRYSQVTHYHFDNCEFFYNPNFSNRYINQFIKRDIMSSLIS